MSLKPHEFGQIKLKFGKYKGKQLQDIPDNYLLWALNNTTMIKGKALVYCKTKLNLPKDTYKVEVEDSVNADGKYIVQAYSEVQAVNICRKQYKIQCTQSFCGTGFSATKIN